MLKLEQEERQDLMYPHQLLPGVGLLQHFHGPAGQVDAVWSQAGLHC